MKCGLAKHDDECSARCVNCQGEHAASSKECPKWKTEAAIQKVRSERGISFAEAKKLVNPESFSSDNYASAAKRSESKDSSSASVSTSVPSDFMNLMKSMMEQIDKLTSKVVLLEQRLVRCTCNAQKMAASNGVDTNGLEVPSKTSSSSMPADMLEAVSSATRSASEQPGSSSRARPSSLGRSSTPLGEVASPGAPGSGLPSSGVESGAVGSGCGPNSKAPPGSRPAVPQKPPGLLRRASSAKDVRAPVGASTSPSISVDGVSIPQYVIDKVKSGMEKKEKTKTNKKPVYSKKQADDPISVENRFSPLSGEEDSNEMDM